MLKNIQIKVVLVFLILGILTTTLVGFVIFNNINLFENSLLDVVTNETEMSMIKEIINLKKDEIIYLFVAIMSAFVVVGFVIAKIVTNPIRKIVKNAEEYAKSDLSKVKYLSDGKKKNEFDSLVATFSDMNSELKENLNEVTRQKKQMETILLHMTDGIIASNVEGKIIHMNPAAKELLNIKDGTKTFDEVFKPINIDINLEKVIYLENWTSSEKKVNIDDKTINLFFAPYKNENDRPDGVIVVIQDITEHEKLNVMRKQFVADVSHELKTPITSILGYTETIIENELDVDTNKKFLSRISEEAERMANLVSDLLTLSRYDNAKKKAEKVEFDLGELVKYTFEGLQFEIDKKKQEAECFVTSNVPLVYADKSGIQRVVLNILTNAIKYTPEGGNIKVYVGFVYNDAYIKIIDTGIGIPEADLERIFERFYRVDKARTREMGGTGLGLSIAKEILDQNNGRIDIKSEPGKGTEVVIRIPTKKEEK